MKEAFHVGDGTLQIVWKKITHKDRLHNSLVSFIFQGVIGDIYSWQPTYTLLILGRYNILIMLETDH